MNDARDPRLEKKRGYVVPTPRVTDAMGGILRRAFAPSEDTTFGDLLKRLDAIV